LGTLRGGVDEVLEFDIPAEARSAGEARRAVRSWLTSRGFPTDRLDDWLVVVSELVTNAVVHADTDIRVVARWDGERVMLEVFDGGHGVPRVLAEPPAVGGRGLFLVEQMTSAWGFEPSQGGKRVWARLGGLADD
jgi:anti-sigma regulatory factor (Ser/Thr protein kinase)